MTSRPAKTLLAFILSWTSGMIACLVNQLPLGDALLRSLGFSILLVAIVAMLAWGIRDSRIKRIPILAWVLVGCDPKYIGDLHRLAAARPKSNK